MNTLVLKNFGAEIVRGADSLGVQAKTYQGSLSPNQAELLERQTGRSISDLALLGIEVAASPEQRERQRDLLRSTMELMAAFNSSEQSGRQPGPNRRDRRGTGTKTP
jgi:hypothetical protein